MGQKDLARAVGVAGPERISAWEHETNEPQVSQIPLLANILGVSPDSLLSGGASNRLRELRWAAGLTTTEVARQLHVGRSTYQRWELGERTIPDRAQLFRQLASALATSEDVVRAAAAEAGSASLSPRGVLDAGGDVTVDADGLPGLADKLNHLFAVVPRSSESARLHSNESAAEALQQAGIRVSGTHLSHLRAGRRDNPSARLLDGIAKLFGVPIAYFFDGDLEREVNAQLATLVAMRDTRVRHLMTRAQGVSPESLGQIEGILDQIRRLEGLEVVDETEGPPR